MVQHKALQLGSTDHADIVQQLVMSPVCSHSNWLPFQAALWKYANEEQRKLMCNRSYQTHQNVPHLPDYNGGRHCNNQCLKANTCGYLLRDVVLLRSFNFLVRMSWSYDHVATCAQTCPAVGCQSSAANCARTGLKFLSSFSAYMKETNQLSELTMNRGCMNWRYMSRSWA